MKIFRYSRWDGKQPPFEIKKKEIIDRFMENIMQGMSPNMSLAKMFWEGFPLAGMDFRVMGLEEMISELEARKNELFEKYTLERIFDKPIDEVRFLLEDEAMTRRQNGEPSSLLYDELSPGLLEKLRALSHFDFHNPRSQAVYESWQAREQDILDLYEFYSEFAEQFVGAETLDFEQALALMRQFQALDQLQKQLMAGQLSEIDPAQLQELLGDQAQQSFNILLQLPQTVSDEGVATIDRRGVGMTPRGLRTLGETAFGKLVYHLKKDRQGGHQGNAPQSGEMLPDSSRRYQYGDRFDLDLTRTIINSIKRGTGGTDGPVQLNPDDFYVREREQLITTTTVLLLDLSWSMSRNGRFEAAKKVALALNHYIRSRFPKDTMHVVGFSTEAAELQGDELALAVWDVNQPFTNLQGGLQLAMRLIKRSGNRNNRVIVITDGQPTAYYIDGELHVEFPDEINGISRNACVATLGEVRKVTAQGMNIETFMLDDNPVLIEFTHQIARINKGRAVLCMPGKLGELVLVEEIKRRGGRI